MLRRIFASKNFFPLLFILIIGVLASRSLLFQEGYFNMHDDLQMMRQLQMEKCFKDGQIPCRWVPDMGYGHGFPLFNYYPPFPYLFGQIFRLLGFSFVMTAKLNFASAIILSGIAMYFFAKRLLNRKAAVLAAVFFMWAPYHAVDVYVRGAMNEAWALVWFPLILLFSYQIIQEKKNITKWVVGLTLSLAALLVTHNLMVLIFTPVIVLWTALYLLANKDVKKLIPLAISGIWALGLAAFFTIPVVFENKLINLNRLKEGYFMVEAHFVSLYQLFFSRFWGYGDSVWGVAEDGMSFQIGFMHWFLTLIVGALVVNLIIKIYRKQKSLSKSMTVIVADHALLAVIFMITITLVAIFMIHSRSIFVWNTFELLKILQFPWRFLSIVIFSVAFISGALFYFVKNKFVVLVLLIALPALVVALNWNYFLPKGGRMGPLTDQQKFTGLAWLLQQRASDLDYLPNTAKLPINSPREAVAEIVMGEGEIIFDSIETGTDWLTFNTIIKSDSAKLRINVYQFPDWQVYINNVQVQEYIDDEELWGRMYIDVPQGDHSVRAILADTRPRYIGNMLSLTSLVIMVIVLVKLNTKNGKQA